MRSAVAATAITSAVDAGQIQEIAGGVFALLFSTTDERPPDEVAKQTDENPHRNVHSVPPSTSNKVSHNLLPDILIRYEVPCPCPTRPGRALHERCPGPGNGPRPVCGAPGFRLWMETGPHGS